MCLINDYIISNAIKTVQEIKKKLKFKINKKINKKYSFQETKFVLYFIDYLCIVVFNC